MRGAYGREAGWTWGQDAMNTGPKRDQTLTWDAIRTMGLRSSNQHAIRSSLSFRGNDFKIGRRVSLCDGAGRSETGSIGVSWSPFSFESCPSLIPCLDVATFRYASFNTVERNAGRRPLTVQ